MPLADSTSALNAHVHGAIEERLAGTNARSPARRGALTCEEVSLHARRGFHRIRTSTASPATEGYRPSANMRLVEELERREALPPREDYSLEGVCGAGDAGP